MPNNQLHSRYSLASEVGTQRIMRRSLLKKHTTKAERVVYEVLKSLHIPFRHRWLIGGREVDFLIGNLCLEIDGHEQDVTKNNMLLELGYTPLHLHNDEVSEATIKLILSYYDYKNTTSWRS